jgi:hypothetical protein
MKPKILTIRLAGSPEDRGAVRLGDFAEFLFETLRCLRGVDRNVSGKEKLSTDYKITGLHSGSATVEVEPVPYRSTEDYSSEIIDRFTDGLTTIIERAEAPPHFDRALLEEFKLLAKPLSRRVSEIEIRAGKKKIRVTKQLEVNIEKIIGEDIKSEGTVAGHLDVVNVHERNLFYIYPVVGPAKIGCQFSNDLLEEVKAALKQYVTVSGTLRYKQNEVFPYQVDAERIEIHPPDDELPTLASLRGIAPAMTGDLDSVEFIRRLRNAS